MQGTALLLPSFQGMLEQAVTTADCVLRRASITTESPVWCEVEQCLYWVDVQQPALQRLDPWTGKNGEWVMPAWIGGRADGGFYAPKRSLMRSATRRALAMMVSVGFTAPIEGKKLASAMYRLSSSCVRQSRSSTERAGSVPKRHVPA